MKKLIIGEVYIFEDFIFQHQPYEFHEVGVGPYIYDNRLNNLNGSMYIGNATILKCRLASPLDKQWLLDCIKAKKSLDKPTDLNELINNNYSLY